jgi:hypothetical protein
MAIRSWFGFASACSLALLSLAVGCSGEDDTDQNTLPAFGNGGTGGTSPVGAAGTAGTAGQGGTGAANNGGTGGAPAGANGGTGGAPQAVGGSGGSAGSGGSGGMGGTGNALGMGGTGGSGMGGTGGAPGAGGTGMNAGMGGTAPVAEAVSFEDEVWPIFMMSCNPCHTTGRSGGQSVGSATLATAFADAMRVSPRLVGRLNGGGMPPNCNTAGTAPCIPLDDLQIVEDWVAGGLQP